jgi:hypothetical protein
MNTEHEQRPTVHSLEWQTSIHTGRLKKKKKKKKTSWPVVRKRTIPTERPLLAAEVSANFSGEGVTWSAQRIPTDVNLSFLDRSRYSLEIAPKLSSRGWVDPVPDPLLRKYGSVRNRTRDLWICRQKLWPLDHRGGPYWQIHTTFVRKTSLLWKHKYVKNSIYTLRVWESKNGQLRESQKEERTGERRETITWAHRRKIPVHKLSIRH